MQDKYPTGSPQCSLENFVLSIELCRATLHLHITCFHLVDMLDNPIYQKEAVSFEIIVICLSNSLAIHYLLVNAQFK